MSIANPQGGFLTLLKKRNFLLLWLAQLISMTILNASNYALIVLIEVNTGSTTLIGLAIVCFSLPAVLFGAPAGVFVDHRNKRRVLWYSNYLRAIATFGFVISLLLKLSQVHLLISVYLLTFLISGIGQFFTPAEGSSIPMLVSEQELMSALSLFNITFMLAQALGFIIFAPVLLSVLPTITIFSLHIAPTATLYAIIGLLYVVCAILIGLIPPNNFKENARAPRDKESIGSQSLGAIHGVWSEVQQGWQFIRRRPALFLPVIQLSFAGILLLVIGELATPVVTRLFQLPASSMALVFAPAGVGLVVGSLFMPRIVRRIGKSRAVFTGSISLAITITMLPVLALLASILGAGFHLLVEVILAPIVMFAAGVEIDFINVPAQIAIQEQTPDWIKGRVLALQLVLYNACSIPVILGIGGIADKYGIQNVTYLVAACIILFGLWGQYYERKPHRWQPPDQKVQNTPDTPDAPDTPTQQTDDRNIESLKN